MNATETPAPTSTAPAPLNLLGPILTQTRPSRFLTALAALPGAHTPA